LGPGLVFPPVSWLWPQAQNDKEANFMDSREARVGTLVGLLDEVKRAGKGRVGTIEKMYGDPDDSDLAVEVRFEDGSVELYWYDELRRMEGSIQEAKALAS
jgi:hypothetical protein